MKLIVRVILLVIMNQLNAQSEYWIKTYIIKFNNRKDTNYFPTYFRAFEIKNDSIFSIFKSTDTTVQDHYGTGFGILDLEGNLLQYRSIPYKGLNNYFFPEEMITFDYRSFYTSVFIKTNNEAILKYNYLTEETKIYDIRNSVCDSCFLRFGGMAKDPNGYLIVAHNISVPNQQDSFYRKVQVIKMDQEGNKIWTKVLGGASTKDLHSNSCEAVYVDSKGNYYIGTTYEDRGYYYQMIVYKLDSLGNVIKEFKSKISQQLGNVYDFTELDNNSLALASASCRPASWFGESSPAITILDSSLNLKTSFLAGRYTYGVYGIVHLEKIVRANHNDGLITVFSNYFEFKYTRYDSTKMKLDTVPSSTRKAYLIKVSETGDSIWRRKYVLREGIVKHWTDAEESQIFELKALPDKSGYLLGGYSYRDNAYEVLNEPYYMPLLIKVDNDGCIIPDCGKTNNIDTKAEEGNKLFTIYPNPFSDRLIIQNYSSNKLLYRVHDMQGKLMTEWYCDDPEETNIVLTHHWPIGVYVINAVDSDGLAHSESIIKQ